MRTTTERPIRACAYCGGRAYKRWWRVNGFDICCCRQCALVQVLQELTDQELGEVYGKGYYNGQDAHVYQNYLADPEAKIAHFGARLDEVCAENHITKPGRCLEIGCAFGLFLRAAQRRGWEVRGTEMSAFSAQWAREHYGLDVSSVPDALHAVASASQDLVVMWDVMEHLREPMDILREIRRILVPGGLLVFATVNVRSLGARLYGRWWYLACPPYHLIYFDRRSVRNMLEGSGLEVRSIKSSGGHPLENMGRFRFLQWIAKKDRYVGWRFNSGPGITVTASKPR